MLHLDSLQSAMNLVPDTIIFLKDSRSRYLLGNQELARMCGLRDERDVRGTGTADFFCPALVERYLDLDHDVDRGRTLVSRLDRAINTRGEPVWCLYSRTAVTLDTGENAIMGISKRLRAGRKQDARHARLALATDRIAAKLDSRLGVSELASLASCSVAQLEQDFHRVIGTTPTGYQARLRLQLAKDLLRGGSGLAAIALDCGFAEQSSFSRFFRAQTGLTPSRYRLGLTVAV